MLTILPDPRMFRAARWTGRACLAIAAGAIIWGLAPLIGIGKLSAAGRGGLPLVITALWCGVSLMASEPDRRGVLFVYMRRVAKVLALFAAGVVVFWAEAGNSGLHPAGIVFPPARVALGFLLLTVATLLLDKKNWMVNRILDVLACGLCLLFLVILLGAAFDSGVQVSRPVLVCLGALVVALALRQAEHGVLSIFLGVGAGSRLARIFAPGLFVMPIAWQAGIGFAERRVSHFDTALVAPAAVGIAIAMLLFFTWRMSRMELEIHDLILRDEATRLYNHKGFHMLAEHAMRLAGRSGIPFSVLFIHMENLAQIYTETGPEGSGAALAEAGEILRATFRESDIKGRIGADQFAVAGQFDRAGVSVAAMRLEAAAEARITKRRGPVPPRFSVGYVTTSEAPAAESLKEMLTRAGQMRHLQTAQLREMPVN